MDIRRRIARTGRGPCTDAERRTAVRLHRMLRAAGHAAWMETEWVRPQWPQALALGAALSVTGSLVAASEPLAGLILAGAAALALAVEASGRTGPLRWPFPRRATQVVLVEPADPDLIALLVCAPTDAPPGRRWLNRRTRTAAAAAAALIAACTAARLAGAEGIGVGAIQFAPTVALLLAIAAAVDLAQSSAARDDGGAPALALALFAELTRTPPARLSAGLVLHGAATGDPIALRRLLKRDGRTPARTVLIDIDHGPGPAYGTRHPQLATAAARAAEAAPAARRSAPPGLRRLPLITLAATPHDEALDHALATVDALDAALHEKVSENPAFMSRGA